MTQNHQKTSYDSKTGWAPIRCVIWRSMVPLRPRYREPWAMARNKGVALMTSTSVTCGTRPSGRLLSPSLPGCTWLSWMAASMTAILWLCSWSSLCNLNKQRAGHNLLLPALLQKLVGEFLLIFRRGNLTGMLAGLLRDFSEPPKEGSNIFGGNSGAFFVRKFVAPKKFFRAKSTLQMCHLKTFKRISCGLDVQNEVPTLAPNLQNA